jgi:hypothetical protein
MEPVTSGDTGMQAPVGLCKETLMEAIRRLEQNVTYTPMPPPIIGGIRFELNATGTGYDPAGCGLIPVKGCDPDCSRDMEAVKKCPKHR